MHCGLQYNAWVWVNNEESYNASLTYCNQLNIKKIKLKKIFLKKIIKKTNKKKTMRRKTVAINNVLNKKNYKTKLSISLTLKK
jgi:hypothetical protein